MTGEADLVRLILEEDWRREALEATAGLGLPDAWIGAGFVRTPVWDRLHGFERPTPLGDIDVIYHDPECLDPAVEQDHEARLKERLPGLPWSVTNQARMHLENGDRPYRSSADAMQHWLETPTAVAVRLTPGGEARLLAPFGLDDLLGLIVRPTPHAQRHRLAAYRARIADKDWLTTWPKVRLIWE